MLMLFLKEKVALNIFPSKSISLSSSAASALLEFGEREGVSILFRIQRKHFTLESLAVE